jgi:serine/threonine protein kinase
MQTETLYNHHADGVLLGQTGKATVHKVTLTDRAETVSIQDLLNLDLFRRDQHAFGNLTNSDSQAAINPNLNSRIPSTLEMMIKIPNKILSAAGRSKSKDLNYSASSSGVAKELSTSVRASPSTTGMLMNMLTGSSKSDLKDDELDQTTRGDSYRAPRSSSFPREVMSTDSNLDAVSLSLSSSYSSRKLSGDRKGSFSGSGKSTDDLPSVNISGNMYGKGRRMLGGSLVRRGSSSSKSTKGMLGVPTNLGTSIGGSLWNGINENPEAYMVGGISRLKCRSFDDSHPDLRTRTRTDSHSQCDDTEKVSVALKIVNKFLFKGMCQQDPPSEKSDTLIRETLSQVLLSNHFLCPSSVTHLGEQCSLKESRSQSQSSDFRLGLERGVAYVDSTGLSTDRGPETKTLGVKKKSKTFDPYAARGRSYYPIVQITNVFETNESFALELELMNSIDLGQLVGARGYANVPQSHGTTLTETQVKQVVVQLVEAVYLCNRLGIAHRDIKMDNITLPTKQWREKWGGDNDDFFFIKLADFGMAGFVNSKKMLRGRCGTPGFAAPDMINLTVQDRNAPYPLNVDMFSIGCVAYSLLCGYETFNMSRLVKSEQVAVNGECNVEFIDREWRNFSAEAKDFVQRCLLKDANCRLTPTQAMNEHPWLKEEFERYHTLSSTIQGATESSCSIS